MTHDEVGDEPLDEPGPPRRRPGKQKVSDEEIERWREQRLSFGEMSRLLQDEGRGISVSALSQRWKKIEERKTEVGQRLMPWIVATEHSVNRYIYSAILAYAKMRKGKGLSDKERRLAREFEQAMSATNSVLYYTRDEGFVTRPRTPADDPVEILVKE